MKRSIIQSISFTKEETIYLFYIIRENIKAQESIIEPSFLKSINISSANISHFKDKLKRLTLIHKRFILFIMSNPSIEELENLSEESTFNFDGLSELTMNEIESYIEFNRLISSYNKTIDITSFKENIEKFKKSEEIKLPSKPIKIEISDNTSSTSDNSLLIK